MKQRKFVVKNPVPTVEEMRKILGLSKRRVERICRIMEGKPVKVSK